MTFGKRIRLQYFFQLCPCSRYHYKIRADLIPDKLANALFNHMCRKFGIDKCIAALDVRAHVCKGGLFERLTELSHGNFISS